MARTNLSTDVADRIRLLVTRGELAAGQRINETELSQRLEVSRTPVREALSRLASEGLVSIRPRHGFYVRSLDAEELRDLYQVRSILDPAALRMGGLVGAARLRRLRRLNEGIGDQIGDPVGLVDADNEWHLELLAHCPNVVVVALIRQFMLRTRSLEIGYMSRHTNVEAMLREHEQIMSALEAGELTRAVEGLRKNMTSAIPVMMAWIGSRGEGL